MGVLRDLPDQRTAVAVGHPVPRLDLPVRGDQRLEARGPLLVAGRGRARGRTFAGGEFPLGGVHLREKLLGAERRHTVEQLHL
ncbi:hypothetical protein [Microbispora sp. GKU 823]|uniref:hypothetical protein n=1 Tax=Microbispora sp. GKU 823 TaxID=1652100 RepID=UPI001C4E00BC|nr:hypothetical protein [Microbispora sp. GKU 823]